ncbi:MAG: alpha/beta hydrolase [Hespellia sp.]|nr:alpha/beta hydrolase [Hespellia sp.]
MKKELDVSVEEDVIKVIPDVVFSQVPDYFGEMVKNLKLDLILPLTQNENSKKRPLIIWIIGGGWRAINKSKFNGELVPYVKQGYTVASIEYRVSSEAVFPAQIIDVKAAIRYLRANADKYNLDPEQFFIMGESAGGHLSALAGTAGDVDEWNHGQYKNISSKVQGCIILYGICDFENKPLYPVPELFHDLAPEELLVGGKIPAHTDVAKAMNPLTYVSDKTPPFLIFHGLNDCVVPYKQSETLYEGLVEENVEADLYLIKNANHADSKFYQKEVRDIIFEFLKERR